MDVLLLWIFYHFFTLVTGLNGSIRPFFCIFLICHIYFVPQNQYVELHPLHNKQVLYYLEKHRNTAY